MWIGNFLGTIVLGMTFWVRIVCIAWLQTCETIKTYMYVIYLFIYVRIAWLDAIIYMH